MTGAAVGSARGHDVLGRRGQRALAQCRLAPAALIDRVATEAMASAAPSLACLASRDPYDVDATISSRFGPLVASFESYEHCDWEFPRWTLLVVLRASRHHRITTAGRSYRLRAGDVVLFDSHRPHALDWAGKRSAEERRARRPFVAMHLEFGSRPPAATVCKAVAESLGVSQQTIELRAVRRERKFIGPLPEDPGR